MAGGDYRSCDVCGCKTFYDVELNYKDEPCSVIVEQVPFKIAGVEQGEYGDRLESLGDWAVICYRCSKTHKCVIQPITPPQG